MQNKTISDQLLEITEAICDKYCKYPQMYAELYGTSDDTNDRLVNEICDKCPLLRI